MGTLITNLLLKRTYFTLTPQEASSACAALLSRNLAYLWLKSFERVRSHSTHRLFTQPTTYVISSANKQCRQFKRTPPLPLFTSGLVLGFLYIQRESSARTRITRIVNKVVRSISEASYATLLALCDKCRDWRSHGC